MKIAKTYLIILIVLLLSGCGGLDSIPLEKKNYIGTWNGNYMRLTITAEAKVDYQYEDGSSSKSISAPIKEFIGNDFKVGAFGINTVFVVSVPPYLENGVWKMVVDNQLVMKQATVSDLLGIQQ